MSALPRARFRRQSQVSSRKFEVFHLSLATASIIQQTQQGDETMQRVSIRTLVLLLELLTAVVALQYVTLAQPVKADVVWLATDFVAPPPAPVDQLDDPFSP
jgi:hypothetical protein